MLKLERNNYYLSYYLSCIEFFAFAVDLISSTQHNFEISHIDNTQSHQFVYITQHSYFFRFCGSLMIKYFVKTFSP